MDHIDAAILRTVLYADVFHFPMSAAEIHHFLIHDEVISRQLIEKRLASSGALKDLLVAKAGYYAVQDRVDLIALRVKRSEAAEQLWRQAVRYGRWLARLPFVRMVAVTGALAMNNADPEDDLDYMIVTEPGRVWLARLFAVMLVRLVQIRGPIICPNYVVAANVLVQDRRDLFIAHEVTQMIPLFGDDIYARIRHLNAWSDGILPNATHPFHPVEYVTPGPLWSLAKSSFERLLRGHIGDRLEQWEHQRKVRRFAAALQTPYSAAQIDESQVKGHFNDYGHGVLRAYEERLLNYGLHQLRATGD